MWTALNYYGSFKQKQRPSEPDISSHDADWKGNKMISEKQTKSANYLCIIAVLRGMKEDGSITEKEYRRAKEYYRKLTGADIVLAD